MRDQARGYIASGEFNGNRTPQHIQNQIIKAYCDSKKMTFVLSRAEYWINGSTDCQLWAALREGFRHIVFFSIWQLPQELLKRLEIYQYCIDKAIVLHFACERLSTEAGIECLGDFEILIKSNLTMQKDGNYWKYLEQLKKLEY